MDINKVVQVTGQTHKLKIILDQVRPTVLQCCVSYQAYKRVKIC